MAASGGKQSRTRDAQQAHETILEAAEAVFAEHGFDGARIDAIAKASGYNVSLLFQYFGDKLNLYTEVLRRAYGEANELRARVFAPLLERSGTPLDANQFKTFLEAAIGGLFDYLVDHPRLMHILLWEMAEGWQTYAKISTNLPTDKAEHGQLAFNGYSKLASRLMVFHPSIKAIGVAPASPGFDDPHEPEKWNPRLKLIDALSIIGSSYVARTPWAYRATCRLMYSLPALRKEGGWIFCYQF